jgi:hypothetical protein
MAYCCAPNVVNLVENCYEWCEVPKKYLKTSDGSQTKPDSVITNEFRSCLEEQGRQQQIIGLHRATGSAPPGFGHGGGVMGLVKVVLVAGVVAVLLG